MTDHISERLERVLADAKQATAAQERINLILDQDVVGEDKANAASWAIRSFLLADLDDVISHTDSPDWVRNEIWGKPWDEFSCFDHGERQALDDDELMTILKGLHILFHHEYSKDNLSQLAMSFSLCPMHFVDWAICFDDENPECEQIRTIFPHSHDT